MTNRRWFGDLGFAVLIALSLVALARPNPVHQHRTATMSAAAKVAVTDRLPGSGRISLLG